MIKKIEGGKGLLKRIEVRIMETWLKKRFTRFPPLEKKRARKMKKVKRIIKEKIDKPVLKKDENAPTLRGRPKKEAPISMREFEGKDTYEKEIEILKLIESLRNPTKGELAKLLGVPIWVVNSVIGMLNRFAEGAPNRLVKERIDAGLSKIREEKRGRKGKEEDSRHVLKKDKKTEEATKQEREDKKQEERIIDCCPKCGGISYPDGPNGRKCNNGHRWASDNTKTGTIVVSKVKDQDSYKRVAFGGTSFPIGWSGETEK